MVEKNILARILNRFGNQNGKINESVTCKQGGLTEYPGPIKQKLMKLVLPLGLNRKEGIQQRSKHGGLSEEGFSKVGSDVCRTTAVFFVLSSC